MRRTRSDTHHEALFAVRPSLHGKEGFPLEVGAAGVTGEALRMEQLIQSRAAGSLPHDGATTLGTHTCNKIKIKVLVL